MRFVLLSIRNCRGLSRCVFRFNDQSNAAIVVSVDRSNDAADIRLSRMRLDVKQYRQEIDVRKRLET